MCPCLVGHGYCNSRISSQVMKGLGFGALPLARVFEVFDTHHTRTVDYKEFLVGLSTLRGSFETALKRKRGS